MKIVINDDFGGFGVSKQFCDYYNIPWIPSGIFGEEFGHPAISISRKDPRLIEYIEKFGSKAASGQTAHLVIEEIPKGCLYKIVEYDGWESIEYRDNNNWEVAED